MKNIVCYVVLLWLPCRIVHAYSPAITRTFAVNSVIVVAISHILSTIYLNNNLLPVSVVAMEGYYSKFTVFTGATLFTKDTNVVAIGSYPRAPT